MPDTCAYVMGGCGKPDCDHQHTLSECGKSRAEHACQHHRPYYRVEYAPDNVEQDVDCFTCIEEGPPLGHEFTAPKP